MKRPEGTDPGTRERLGKHDRQADPQGGGALRGRRQVPPAVLRVRHVEVHALLPADAHAGRGAHPRRHRRAAHDGHGHHRPDPAAAVRHVQHRLSEPGGPGHRSGGGPDRPGLRHRPAQDAADPGGHLRGGRRMGGAVRGRAQARGERRVPGHRPVGAADRAADHPALAARHRHLLRGGHRQGDLRRHRHEHLQPGAGDPGVPVLRLSRADLRRPWCGWPSTATPRRRRWR